MGAYGNSRRGYFAHATGGGAIKMGATSDLINRVKSLGVCIPGGMEVITSVPGHFRRESYIKSALAPWRLQGEWLRICAPVWSVVIEAITTGNISWAPVDEIRSTDGWQAEFDKLAATPGFHFINNGTPGKTLFGRAQFAADLFYCRLPAWLIEAHKNTPRPQTDEVAA